MLFSCSIYTFALKYNQCTYEYLYGNAAVQHINNYYKTTNAIKQQRRN